MITTLFLGHPDQYLHTLACRHRTPLQQQTLLRRVLGVLTPSWQHLLLRYLQRFRTIRPPVV